MFWEHGSVGLGREGSFPRMRGRHQNCEWWVMGPVGCPQLVSVRGGTLSSWWLILCQ